MDKILSFKRYKCGYEEFNFSELYRQCNSGIKKLPVNVFLIEHKKKGHILINTGCSNLLKKNPVAYAKLTAKRKLFFEEKDSISAQLLAEGIDLGQSLIGDEVLIMEGQVQTIQTISDHIGQELVGQGDTIGGQSDNLDACILQPMDDITDVRMEGGFAAEDNRFLDIVSVDQFNNILGHLPDWNGERMVSVTIDAVRTVPVALVGGDHRQVGIVGHQTDVLRNIDVGLEDFQRVFLNCSHNLTDLLY